MPYDSIDWNKARWGQSTGQQGVGKSRGGDGQSTAASTCTSTCTQRPFVGSDCLLGGAGAVEGPQMAAMSAHTDVSSWCRFCRNMCAKEDLQISRCLIFRVLMSHCRAGTCAPRRTCTTRTPSSRTCCGERWMSCAVLYCPLYSCMLLLLLLLPLTATAAAPASPALPAAAAHSYYSQQFSPLLCVAGGLSTALASRCCWAAGCASARWPNA